MTQKPTRLVFIHNYYAVKTAVIIFCPRRKNERQKLCFLYVLNRLYRPHSSPLTKVMTMRVLLSKCRRTSHQSSTLKLEDNDNDPEHWEWFQKNKTHFLEQPNQKPQLYPIEMLWNHLKVTSDSLERCLTWSSYGTSPKSFQNVLIQSYWKTSFDVFGSSSCKLLGFTFCTSIMNVQCVCSVTGYIHKSLSQFTTI